MEWAHLQLLHDLRGVALACDDALPRVRDLADAKDRPLVGDVLASILEEPQLKCDVGDSYNLTRKAMQIGAWRQNDDPDIATLCIAILLADVWHTNIGLGSLDQGWTDLSPFIMNLSPARRAVILKAYSELRLMGKCDVDSIPNPSEFPTEDADDIIAPLCQMAREMDEDQLVSIAKADYGRDIERHLAALRKVLKHDQCRFPEDDVWFPVEVVGLVGYDPDAIGFIGCTALLIVDDVKKKIRQVNMSFRWMNEAATYCTLPSSQREPILRGIRYIYERRANAWDPYSEWKSLKIEKDAVYVPYFDS